MLTKKKKSLTKLEVKVGAEIVSDVNGSYFVAEGRSKEFEIFTLTIPPPIVTYDDDDDDSNNDASTTTCNYRVDQ